MNKNDLSNALTEVELSHKRESAVFGEITRNLFEDTTPNSEYSCQYEHYVALADTVNYSSVVKLVTKTMQEGPYNLIERAATRVAEAVLAAFPTVEQVDVLLKKPQAPIKATFSYVAVAISRKRN